MIYIQHATYGEHDASNGYTLLSSSFPQPDIPKRLGNVTDLSDRPPDVVLSKPVIRGFFKDEYFLLIKSFPDISSTVRRGRVFSHALIIKKGDFLKIRDITNLLQYHLAEIDKGIEIDSIEIQNSDLTSTRTPIPTGRIASAINGLVEHTSNDNTVVWVGEESYWEWISCIWGSLPDSAKENIKIGVAFNPQKVDSSLLNLIYVPVEFKQNWLKTNFKLVDLQSEDSLNSQTAHYLVGDIQKAQELRSLLTDFDPKITEIDDLLQFEKMVPAYRSIREKPNVKQLLLLVDLVSKYSPNPKSAGTNKLNLLQAIISGLLSADTNEIFILSNPDWTGFEGAEKTLSSALSTWLDKNLYANESAVSKAPIIEKAFTNNGKDWWGKTIQDKLRSSLINWRSDAAKFIWDWFNTKPSLIEILGSILPNEAEADIASNIPKLKQSVAEKVINLAKSKKWLRLHGLVALNLHSPEEAIAAQLSIDTDTRHIHALESMANEIDNKEFIKIAVKLADQRLSVIAGMLCKTNPKLLVGIQIDQNGWQEIWLEVLKQGSNLWTGVPDPRKTLYSILTYILDGGNFNETLLLGISVSSFNDLREYPKREAIWPVLSQNCKGNFLTATAYSCVKTAAQNNLPLKNLEEPLYHHIQAHNVIENVMKDSGIAVSFKINLFNELPKIGQREAIFLIDSNRLPIQEAITIGQKVLHSKWETVASHLYSLRGRRPDLKPVLQQCFSLLGFWDRLALWTEAYTKNTISTEEWWDTLTNRAIDLFPYGPDQNGIWETAGGHNADLNHNTSGKQKWKDALRKIRLGGKPRIESLLNMMLVEFPNDEILRKLKNII